MIRYAKRKIFSSLIFFFSLFHFSGSVWSQTNPKAVLRSIHKNYNHSDLQSFDEFFVKFGKPLYFRCASAVYTSGARKTCQMTPVNFFLSGSVWSQTSLKTVLRSQIRVAEIKLDLTFLKVACSQKLFSIPFSNKCAKSILILSSIHLKRICSG